MGVPSRRIITRHIVPNVASILIIDAALNVGVAILAETGLSSGFRGPTARRLAGTLIADGTNSATTFPWGVPVPGRGAGADRGVRQPDR